MITSGDSTEFYKTSSFISFEAFQRIVPFLNSGQEVGEQALKADYDRTKEAVRKKLIEQYSYLLSGGQMVGVSVLQETVINQTRSNNPFQAPDTNKKQNNISLWTYQCTAEFPENNIARNFIFSSFSINQDAYLIDVPIMTIELINMDDELNTFIGRLSQLLWDVTNDDTRLINRMANKTLREDTSPISLSEGHKTKLVYNFKDEERYIDQDFIKATLFQNKPFDEANRLYRKYEYVLQKGASYEVEQKTKTGNFEWVSEFNDPMAKTAKGIKKPFSMLHKPPTASKALTLKGYFLAKYNEKNEMTLELYVTFQEWSR